MEREGMLGPQDEVATVGLMTGLWEEKERQVREWDTIITGKLQPITQVHCSKQGRENRSLFL